MAARKLKLCYPGGEADVISTTFIREWRRWFVAGVCLKEPDLWPVVEIFTGRNYFYVVLFGRMFVFGRPLSGGKTFRRAKWQKID